MSTIPAPRSYHYQIPWNTPEWIEGEHERIWLLTPPEVKQLPLGTTLTSINYDKAVAGEDVIDLDTRFGYTAWGLHESQFNTTYTEEI